MNSLRCGRTFVHRSEKNSPKTLCLAFTPDNRYLLASLSTSELVIWSIIDNMEVQTIPLEQQIVAMALTPDGGYLLTAYSNSN